MSSAPTSSSACARKPAIEVGAFEQQGILGISLALGPDILVIRMACPHPALGLADDKGVLLTMDGLGCLCPRPALHAGV